MSMTSIVTDAMKKGTGLEVDPAAWKAFLANGAKECKLEDPQTSGVQFIDTYNGGCVTKFAWQWARYMEAEIGKGHEVEDIAWHTMMQTDAALGNTTYGIINGATVLLARAWKHGAELTAWHNSLIGKAGSPQSSFGRIEPKKAPAPAARATKPGM